ncbi:unnamed protein product [Phytophthora fragariaefolia]|uniref:Unnamed protein product n=1 Tax=Phytophthora fragariaefolia TaxID=1490495 RepID=A0A9W7D365_9STRA|nr:unnamed protein product [Phytophthora fragariaefolia]
MVSSRGELYCSVLDDKYVVASDLQSSRWYHVALTYDHDCQRQEVYLEGIKVWSKLGSRHREWSQLSCGQVGTGCVTSDSLDCPRQGHIGWYGFHGLVDVFRVWRGVLTKDELKELATGMELATNKPTASTNRTAARAAQSDLQLNVRLAKCTRPAERSCGAIRLVMRSAQNTFQGYSVLESVSHSSPSKAKNE